MSTAHESRPQADPGAAKSFGGDYPHDSAGPVNIGLMTPGEWRHFVQGYQSGATWGIGEGRRQADDEAAARHRAAARVVVAMSKIPARDAEADRAAAARRDARWSK